jgi:DNA-binding NarL/FixJ family response regulator
MNIALLDEDLLLVSALQHLLSGMIGVNSVDVYTDIKQAAEHDAETPFDLVVVDLSMPGLDGIEPLETCRMIFSERTRILAFLPLSDIHTLKHIIRRGASGIISKSATYEEFRDAVLQVGEGKQYIGKDLRDNVINSVFTEQVVLHLSPREKEVLQKVCSGHTIKEIAYDLKLSAHTVQYYHRSVMEKFKVKRTTDLIVYAIQHKLYIPEHTS